MNEFYSFDCYFYAQLECYYSTKNTLIRIDNLEESISLEFDIPKNEILVVKKNLQKKYLTIYTNQSSFYKTKKLEESLKKVKDNYSSLQSNYSFIQTINNKNEQIIKNLNNQIQQEILLKEEKENDYLKLKEDFNKVQNQIQQEIRLKEEKENDYRKLKEDFNKVQNQIQQEIRLKEEKENNYRKLKEDFDKVQKLIENENVEESKMFIEKFIINKFLKEFIKEKEKQSDFKNSLISYMNTFTEEFMQYSQKFLLSFKIYSQNIIKEYNIKENNIIEHINFIVLGKAGVGKSTLINECLMLSGNHKAKEGKGKSVTEKSTLYSSEKLKMIRMWDTQGLDYRITQEFILKEVKRLVEDGLNQGPDHYINIILYCTSGDRFQDEDGQLIFEIMKLYPLDNLPVIITQLQAYFKNKSKEMEKIIREILENYLEYNIVKKIEIKSIVARDFEDENIVYKAEGIPELLRLSFDIMGRAISSATCKKISQDIENLCKDYVDKKIEYINNIFKNEMEILEIAKCLLVEDIDDEDDYFDNQQKKVKKELSEFNVYKKIQNDNCFVDNFVKIMTNKFIDIFNNLNNENIMNIKEENQNNNQENNKEDKPLVLIFIEDKLKNMKKKIDIASNKAFEKIFKIRFQNYLSNLQREQSVKNKEYNDNSQIIDIIKVEKQFKEKLFSFFKNEFFKFIFCIIIKLFMNNLKNILISNYQNELKVNEITKKINQRAEDSLKSITEKLKEHLIIELNNYFREKKVINKKKEKSNEFDNIDADLIFK